VPWLSHTQQLWWTSFCKSFPGCPLLGQAATATRQGMAATDGNYLSSSMPLRASGAVAAILVVDRERYLLQLRDDVPNIWYPGHWGLFGGAVDAGEDEIAALRRELREELELELQTAELFVRFDFDLTPMGLTRYARAYYEVPISGEVCERLVLHEGADMRALPGDAALSLPRLSPYDSFALFMHHHRRRITR
jgi:8-oxo-dGTP pyrophosphatase MutT (NUDIX family)